MKCKTCGIKYHYCSNCGIDGYSEYGYCSEDCYEMCDEVIAVIDYLQNLSIVKRNKLIKLYNNVSDRAIDIAIKKVGKGEEYRNKPINDKIEIQ